MIPLESILNSQRLPSVPAVAVRLLELVTNDEMGVRDIIEVVRADPALTARIIQAANASTLGVHRQVTSLDLAVALLGKTIVASISLSFSLIPHDSAKAKYRHVFHNYWLKSIIQAAAAKALQLWSRKSNAEELFLVGLLCDLGQLALLSAAPAEYTQVSAIANSESRQLVDVEQEQFGFTHVELGTKLAERWNMPDIVRRGIEAHHAKLGGDIMDEVHQIAIFSSLAAELLMADGCGTTLQALHSAGSSFFGMDEQVIKTFLVHLRKDIEKVASLLSVDASQLGDTEAILWQANNQLLRMAMAVQARHDEVQLQNHELREQNRQLVDETQEIKNVALRDALTNLPNPHFLNEYLPHEVSRCQRSQSPLGVLFCDVDHFKAINDTYGHAAGDEVLRRVARVLESSVRASDVVLRYGGEEFLIIANSTREDELAMVAERIRSGIAAEKFTFNGAVLRITASIGGALGCPPPRCEDRMAFARWVIDQADQAMYDCKKAGRNRCLMVNLEPEQWSCPIDPAPGTTAAPVIPVNPELSCGELTEC